MSVGTQESGLEAGQLDGINRILKSSNFEETLRQDIVELQTNITEIRRLFGTVHDSLEDFDYNHAPTNPTRHLAPEWRGFSSRFEDCVDKSRESAVAASSTMKMYSNAVLGKVGEVDCDVNGLTTEIKKFLRGVERHIPAARNTRSNFKQLANDVRDFERTVERTLRQLSLPPSEDINRICGNIDELKRKVAAMSNELVTLGTGYFKSVASLAPRAAELLCTISPRAALQALAVFVLPAAQVDIQNQVAAQAELELAAAQMSAALESAHMPPEVRPFYEAWRANTRGDILTVATRIDAIAQIWTHLRVDLLTLESNLSLFAGRDRVANSNFLMEKIGVSQMVLLRLAKCLELYVYQIPQESTARETP